MIYALVITIAAGLVLLALPTGLFLAGRRAVHGDFSLRGWRWHPNALGFTVLAIVAAVVLWRIFPEFLFLPLVIPFFWRWRGRRSGGPFAWTWRARRQQQPPPTNGHRKDDDHAIEGQYRNLDDD
jgi:hypothetical protein